MSPSGGTSVAAHDKSKTIAKAIQSPTLQTVSAPTTAVKLAARLSRRGVAINIGLLVHEY